MDVEKSVGPQERRVRDTVHILESSFLTSFLFFFPFPFWKTKKQTNQILNNNLPFAFLCLSQITLILQGTILFSSWFFFKSHLSCSEESSFEFLLFISLSLSFPLSFSISFLFQGNKKIKIFYSSAYLFFFFHGEYTTLLFFLLSYIISFWSLLFLFLITDTFWTFISVFSFTV